MKTTLARVPVALFALVALVACGGPTTSGKPTASTPASAKPAAPLPPETTTCAGAGRTPGPVDANDWLLIDARKTSAKKTGASLALESMVGSTVSPNGRWGAVRRGGILRVFDLSTRTELAWPAGLRSVHDIQLATHHALVKTTSSADGSEADLTLIEIASGRPIAKQHVQGTFEALLSRDGTRFAIQSAVKGTFEIKVFGKSGFVGRSSVSGESPDVGVTSVLSSDGRWLVSAVHRAKGPGPRCTLEMHPLDGGKNRSVALTKGDACPNALAVGRNADRIAYVEVDAQQKPHVIVLDSRTGRPRTGPELQSKEATFLAFDDDESRVAVTNNHDGRFFEVGRLDAARLDVQRGADTTRAAIATDGSIAEAYYGGLLLRSRDGSITELAGAPEPVRARLSSDGASVVLFGDTTVHWYSATTGELHGGVISRRGDVFDAIVSGDELTVGTTAGELQLVRDKSRLRPTGFIPADLSACSPNHCRRIAPGLYGALESESGGVVFRFYGPKTENAAPIPGRGRNSHALAEDGTFVSVGPDAIAVRNVCTTSSWKELRVPHLEPNHRFVVVAEGAVAVTSKPRTESAPDDVHVLSTTTGEELALYGSKGVPVLSANARILASRSGDEIVLHSATGAEVLRQPFGGPTQRTRAPATFSRDGARAALALADGTVLVVDTSAR